MTTRKAWTWALTGVCCCFAVSATLAQDHKQHDNKQHGDKHDGGQMEMTPEMKACMEAGTPGSEHKLLEPMIGTWTVEATDYSMGEPQTSTASSKSTWIMDGRYVRTEYTGDFGGMQFKGEGICGYSNLDKAYVSCWFDNMSTGIFHETGSYDPDTKTFTYTGKMIDPMTKKPTQTKSVTKIESPNKHTMTMYNVKPSGEEKVMTLVFTRSKQTAQAD